MKKILLFLISLLLLSGIVTAHSIQEGPISKGTEEYTVQFVTMPLYPVTGKQTHLDFIIIDHKGEFLSELPIQIELHTKDAAFTLQAQEEQKGHYNVEYNFDKADDYDIHIIMNNQELEVSFDLEVDTFGLSGLLRSVTIIILLLMLLVLVYKDCTDYKKKKDNA